MKKTLLRLLFAAMLACGAMSAQVAKAQDFIVDGIQYYKTSDKTCEIMQFSTVSGNNRHAYRGDFVIPESVEYSKVTYTVTGIRNRAFHDCDIMTSITIPNTVTYIGDEAFYRCKMLKEVVIPESVTKIGAGAFEECSRLVEVDILGDIEIVSKKMFYVCSALKTVKLPETVKTIAGNAFDECEELESINMPSQLVYIYEYAFSDCSSLESIVIPNTVKKIDRYAFLNCISLKTVTLSSSMTDIPTGCFAGCDNLSKVAIPESITSISSGSFSGCSALTNIKLPNGLESIGDAAFKDCTSLSTLILPSTVSYINDGAFSGSGLYSISYLGATETTLKYKFDCGVVGVEKLVYPMEYKHEHEENGVFLCDGLVPGEEYNVRFAFRYNGDNYCFVTRDKRTTRNISFTFEYECLSPLELCCYGEYSAGDAEVTWSGFTDIDLYDGNEPFSVEGDTLKLTELIPGRVYNICYTVVANGKKFKTNKNIRMTELELTPLPAKATSNTVALICAETNLPDGTEGVGFEWRRYDAPEEMPSSVSTCPVIDGVLTGSLNNLSPSTYYKFRPFYKSVDGKFSYGEWVAFITADAYVYFDPTVRTYAATGVTEITADVSATVVQGSDAIIEQGFEYWSTATRAAAMRKQTVDMQQGVQTVVATGQTMRTTLNGLQPGTGYTFRAYVKTANGITYGQEQTFKTLTSTGLSINTFTTDAVEATRYDAAGRKIGAPVRGINIIVMSDGSVRKVFVK